MVRNRKVFKIIVAILIIIIVILIGKIAIKGISEIIKKHDVTEKSCFPDNVYGVIVHTDLINIDDGVRRGTLRKIKYVVIHETANYSSDATAESHAQYLNKYLAPNSWHYTVDENEIYHHVPDNERANHAGEKIGNDNGIGIELCVNEGSDFEKTLDNAAKLVAYLLKEYDLTIDDVKTHRDFSGKDCPHKILSEGRFDEFKNKVLEYYSM